MALKILKLISLIYTTPDVDGVTLSLRTLSKLTQIILILFQKKTKWCFSQFSSNTMFVFAVLF